MIIQENIKTTSINQVI